MTEFTPWMSLLGGGLLGLSAVFLMAATGRIAGISGILSRLLPPEALTSSNLPGLFFVIGILVAVPVYRLFLSNEIVVSVNANNYYLIVSGLLVGIGGVVGNGCTSGHGICGLSRLSMRSAIATVSFMLAAFVTVYIVRHVVGA